jgi:TetR/AcrR family transcriptional regulator, transcriptional repressor for nem operon
MQHATARRGPKPNPDTRRKLLDAGVRMLHTGGYASTSVQDIVGAAAVPKGSFYNHFESKEAFGAAVVDAYFEPREENMRALFGDTGMAPLDRLSAYFDRRIVACKKAGYAQGCLLGNLSLEVTDRSVAMRERIAGKFEAWAAFIEECIREAKEEGAMQNPLPAPQLAQFVLNSWEGALVRMRAEKSATALQLFKQVVFQSILR